MTDAQTPDMRAPAREYDDAGLCVLPIKADGTKAPAVRSWTPYKVNRSTPAEHDSWFPPGTAAGIAVVYGAVSGGVEMIEFEGTAVKEGLLDDVTEIMSASGLGTEWQAILTGWASESPSGGRHFRVRPGGAPVRGNTKLASRLARPEEYTPEEKQRLAEKPSSRIVRVQIETRGEGGTAWSNRAPARCTPPAAPTCVSRAGPTPSPPSVLNGWTPFTRCAGWSMPCRFPRRRRPHRARNRSQTEGCGLATTSRPAPTGPRSSPGSSSRSPRAVALPTGRGPTARAG